MKRKKGGSSIKEISISMHGTKGSTSHNCRAFWMGMSVKVF